MGRKQITAKYSGHCYDCGGIILAGDRIVHDYEERVSWCLECDRGSETNKETPKTKEIK